MAETRHPVSDVMLARYVAGDLHGSQLERIERAIKEVPGVAERLARVKSDREAFLRDHPPQAFAHRIVTRITVEKRPRTFWQVWWMLPPVGVATALLIGVFVNRAVGPDAMAPAQVTTDDRSQLAAAAPPAWEPQPEPARDDEEAPKVAQKEAKDRAAPLKQTVASESQRHRGARDKADAADDLETEASANAIGHVEKDVAKNADKKTPQPMHAGEGAGLASAGKGADSVAGGAAFDGVQSRFAQPPPGDAALALAPANGPAPAEVPVAAKPAPSAAPARASAAPAPPPAPPAAQSPASVSAEVSSPARPGAEARSVAKSAKAKSGASDEARKAELADAPARPAPTVVSITREEATGTKVVTGVFAISAGSVLKVSAMGGRWVTVVGVRNSGRPVIYGQSAIPDDDAGTGTVVFRVAPTKSRVPEALFVVVSDERLGSAITAEGERDSNQLPLRLSVGHVARRIVINVTPAVD